MGRRSRGSKIQQGISCRCSKRRRGASCVSLNPASREGGLLRLRWPTHKQQKFILLVRLACPAHAVENQKPDGPAWLAAERGSRESEPCSPKPELRTCTVQCTRDSTSYWVMSPPYQMTYVTNPFPDSATPRYGSSLCTF